LIKTSKIIKDIESRQHPRLKCGDFMPSPLGS
jgi:hypothetical protein